jgi:hypothetical protein
MTPEVTAVLAITVTVITFYGLWKVFEKAGESGWKAVIPFYNFYVLLRISDYSGWYFLMLGLPAIAGVLHGSLMPFLFCSPANDVGCGAGWLYQVPDFLLSSRFWSASPKAVLILSGALLSYLAIAFGFIIFLYRVLDKLSHYFNQSRWFSFGLLLLPFIFFPILGLSNAKYQSSKQGSISLINSERFKNKYVSLLVTAIIVAGVYYIFQPEEKVKVISEDTQTITFVGQVQPGGKRYGVDAGSAVIVGGMEVLSSGVFTTQPRGDISENISSGDLVKVYAEKQRPGKVSIYGSENYYIKMVVQKLNSGNSTRYLTSDDLNFDENKKGSREGGSGRRRDALKNSENEKPNEELPDKRVSYRSSEHGFQISHPESADVDKLSANTFHVSMGFADKYFQIRSNYDWKKRIKELKDDYNFLGKKEVSINDYAAQKFMFEKSVNECKNSAIVIERPERDYFLSNLWECPGNSDINQTMWSIVDTFEILNTSN